MAAKDEMLPNPLTRPRKAPRERHPSEPDDATPPPAATTSAQTPRAAAAAANRVGPGKTRKSLYIATDVAAQLTALTDAIHHDSRGSVSKADAAGELIRRGLTNADAVYRALGVPHPPHIEDV